MAMLELCFANPALFDSSLKVSKGDALRRVVEADRGMERVCYIFCRYLIVFNKGFNRKSLVTYDYALNAKRYAFLGQVKLAR